MKHVILFSLALTIMSCSVFKKEPKTEPLDLNKIYTQVDKQPEFPGGNDALFQYLGKTITYPAAAKEAGTTGKVYVSFVIKRDGSISTVKMLRGIGNGCDEVAMEAVQNMPNWSPGEIKNQSVRTQFVLPVNFTLK